MCGHEHQASTRTASLCKASEKESRQALKVLPLAQKPLLTASVARFPGQPSTRIDAKGRKLVSRMAFRPSRSGHPRRKPKGYSAQAEGAGPRRQTRSLDNSNQLATSDQLCVRDWLKDTETKMDRYAKSCYRQAVLLGSVRKIITSLQLRIDRMEEILFNPACEAWLTKHSKLDGKLQNLYARALLHQQRRQKDYDRLSSCQQSWMGFKPKCCDGRALAVPIGCNHRLCFLCNSRRAEKYRDRVRVLFDRLTHPAFLTLTVPNIPMGSLRKRVYSDFRKRVNKLRKAYSGYMKGGILGIETTFNNQPESSAYRTWHVHAHILFDGATALPLCRCRGRILDEKTGKIRRRHGIDCEFIRFKRRLEFDWLCISQNAPRGERWRPSDFDYWFARTIPENWRDASARDKWNSANRRVVDVRRVKNRKKAAFEVLKYATKAAYFIDVPEAVNEFIDATKGARMLQTFGTWYGFKFDDDVNTWAHLKCGCGCNEFERIGIFYRMGVESDASGQWFVKEIVLAREKKPSPPGQT